MRNFLVILCLTIGLGCSSIGQKGIVQDNKVEQKNQFVSRVVPKAETAKKAVQNNPTYATVKLENGGTIKPQEKVTSTNINPPNEVKEEKGLIPFKKEQVEKIPETKEEREEFWDRVFRYSLFWFSFVGFLAIAFYAFKKNKMPSFNPFKKKEQKIKPPEQLNLNL